MRKLTPSQKGLCIALLVTLTDLISKWAVYAYLVSGGKIVEITTNNSASPKTSNNAFYSNNDNYQNYNNNILIFHISSYILFLFI